MGFRYAPGPVSPTVAQPQEAPEAIGDIVGTALEEIPRVAARGVVGFAGVPGEIGQLAETLRPKPTISEENIQQALTQGLITPEEYDRAIQSVSAMSQQEKIESERRLEQESRLPQLPTSEDLTQLISSVIEEPRTEIGKRVGEVAELTGRLMFPLGKPLSAKRALIAGASGKAARLLTKHFNLSDTKGDIAEAGAVLGSIYLGGQNTRNLASKLYKRSKEAIPEQFNVVVKEYKPKIVKPFKEWVNIGLTTASKDKQLGLKIVSDLEKVILKNGNINVKSLFAAAHDLNGVISRQASKQFVPELIQLKKGIYDLIKNNPNIPRQASEGLFKANSLYAGIRGAERAAGFLGGNPGLVKKMGGPIAGGVLYYMMPPELRKMALPVVAGGLAIAQLKNLFKNPAFVKAHIQLVNAAIKESAPALIKAANKMNKIAPKAQRKRTFRYAEA